MDLKFIEDLLSGGGNILEKLPDPQVIVDWINQVLLILVLVGPILMIVMGLLYCFAAPKEANHHFGYRCYFGMGSVEAWQYTQRTAGITWISLGVVLLTAMLVVRRRFDGMDTMEMLSTGVVCVLVQAAALVVASLFIRLTVFFRFDRHGERRKEKRKRKKVKHFS